MAVVKINESVNGSSSGTTLAQDYAFQRGFIMQLEVIIKSKVSLSIKFYNI
jgi:hypothetical protein